MQEVKCRVAPSLGGGFAGTPEQVWGTPPYNPETDINKPCVFFGLYGLPDFYALWKHKGKKYILWAGSDITHFTNGYWLDEKGFMKLNPISLAKWINKNCESWVENQVEYEALKKLGIWSQVCPSFLGNVEDYEISFKQGNKVYCSVSGDDFDLYKWPEVLKLAKQNEDIDFYLYGNTKQFKHNLPNVFVKGRVSQEQMNKEVKEMQGALRLLSFDGCSELVVKGALWGQYPISLISYPHTLKPTQIRDILDKKEPNHLGRVYFIDKLNKFPWNQKK